ncbi:ABC transporter substrate-binding protein [Paenibacillus apis]|uniref:Iron-uptake system-binding protein n=1 Tax=Paenibacillus apis TaxID=1792174 RepID=A0A919Y0E5_9BACL|nr:ABC transporter substrate-binding protein [Paenibacillus apis]GIO42332.1 iron-uptake system-binding protein [Paenibacillus apis]
MKKSKLMAFVLLAAVLLISGCGANKTNEASGNAASNNGATNGVEETQAATTETEPEGNESATRVIKYLDQEYTVPSKIERIVITGAVEAMEDAIVLDVQPVGAISFAGEFPELFSKVTANAVSIGEKTEPNFEQILSLKPDVILGTSKFKPEVAEQLNKIATMIPYSHISTNWESNLKLLGEISGKTAEAEAAIAQYKSDLEAGKGELGEALTKSKVVTIRIRGGEAYVYPKDVFFNPVLYEDLGFTVPAEIEAAEAQELISTEKLAEMNPDYLFIQFSEAENTDTPKALEEFQNNPIVGSLDAFKNGHAFVNVVDPLAQGGTAYSKIEFLKAVLSSLK